MDLGMCFDLFLQSRHDCVSCRIGRMHDATFAVTALASQVQCATVVVFRACKYHAAIGEPLDAFRPAIHDIVHDLGLAQARARGECVSRVDLW